MSTNKTTENFSQALLRFLSYNVSLSTIQLAQHMQIAYPTLSLIRNGRVNSLKLDHLFNLLKWLKENNHNDDFDKIISFITNIGEIKLIPTIEDTFKDF